MNDKRNDRLKGGSAAVRYERFYASHLVINTLDEFLAYVDELRDIFPEWRRGQTFFNALDRIRPELSDAIRGTDADPYYDNARMLPFMEWLVQNWEPR